MTSGGAGSARDAPPLVLHVTEAYGAGTMNVIHDYVAATPELRHAILASPRDEDTGLRPAPGVELRTMPPGGPAAVAAIRRTVRELRPDIVHAHSSIGGGLVRLTPGVGRRRTAYTPHCFAFEREDLSALRRRAFHALEWALSRRTGLLVGVSPREVTLARSLRRGLAAAYVPNVPAMPAPAPAGAGGAPAAAGAAGAVGTPSRVVVTAGRISPQKDPHFLAAVARASARLPGVHPRFVWCGHGDPDLVAVLRDAGVEVTGWLPRAEVLDRLARAGAYLHTSRWEGTPLTVLEAAATGLPLVVRRTPALDGLDLPGLVDTPEQAAQRLAALLPAHADPVRHAGLLTRHSPAVQRAALVAAYTVLCPAVARHVGGPAAAHRPARPATRVAMFINSLQRGGAEQQFLRVARALQRRGHEVRIYTLLPGVDFDEAALAGIPVVLLSPRPGPRTAVAAVRALRGWRADVVVGFLYQATVLARVAAAAARTPVVVSSMRNERLETRARTLVYRATGRLDSVTVTNSARAAQVLQDDGTVRRGRLRVIANGLDLAALDRPAATDLRAELGLPAEVLLFLGVGRLEPQKAWPVLLEAVARYAGPPAHWAIAGDGAGRADLEAQLDRRGLGDRVTLLGLRDDVPTLLRAADALVLASTYEGLPNAVLEAMALGRPVVATRVGGCPELVAPDTGLLVDPGDPAALAAAMTELAGYDAAARERMGAVARDRVRARYGLPAADRAWGELVDELVGGRADGRADERVDERVTAEPTDPTPAPPTDRLGQVGSP